GAPSALAPQARCCISLKFSRPRSAPCALEQESDAHSGAALASVSAHSKNWRQFNLKNGGAKLSASLQKYSGAGVTEAIAYAAQENLRLAEAPEAVAVADTQYAPENPLLSRLPEPVREAFAPLRRSRYAVVAVTDWSGIAHPIFRATAGGPVRGHANWLHLWCRYLITQNRRHREAVRGAAARGRADTAFAAFLLPHLILQLVMEGQPGKCHQLHGEASRAGAEKPVAELDAASLSAQTVFSVIDFFYGWTRHHLNQLKAGAEASDASYRRACDFLAGVPQTLLARAAFSCRAGTRALRHWELAHREQQPPLQRASLRTMAQVYDSLGESDAVAGVFACLSGGELDIRSRILRLENSGQLPQALVAYDVAVRSEAGRNDLSLHRGLLQCELNSASLLNAVQKADWFLRRRPDWAAELNEVRAEALWKLGQWEPLRAPQQPAASWPIGVGRILCSLHERNSAASRGALTDLAANQVPALAAAALEPGCYERAYPTLCRLHALAELQAGLDYLDDSRAGGDSSAAQQQRATDRLLQAWDLRLSLLAPSYTAQDTVISSRLGFARIAADAAAAGSSAASASGLSSSTLSTSSTASETLRRDWRRAVQAHLLRRIRSARLCGRLAAAQAALLEAEQLPPLPDSAARRRCRDC
uniref:non-specific serine/threonine protein kinase n=1 Tax=Macrostomum lignano TaxID=282301 RepID=A0A1I8HY19_9PLAT